VFGGHEAKMNDFSFVDETYLISDIPEDLKIDHAFECVGGSASENAINQIIDYIHPQGMISLLGVSENPVPINTRMVLEKGLILQGNSRSNYNDFQKAIDLINANPELTDYLSTIISEEVEVRSIDDMILAFENDVTNEFKTIMKWCI
jgi:ribitol-5-phosphate 2-dehydrogenase